MVLDAGTRLLDADDVNRSTATGTPLVVAPLTGATITLLNAQRVLYVNPAGTIAALTVRLPSMVNPGGVVQIGFGQIVTALTIQGSDGSAVVSTAGAISQAHEYRWLGLTPNSWVRWR